MFEEGGARKIRSEIVVPPTMGNVMLKAVKANDALVENSIWDMRVLSREFKCITKIAHEKMEEECPQKLH